MDRIKQLENKYSVARYELIKQCGGEELRFYLYLKLYAINKHEAFPTYKTIKDDLGWQKGKISKLIKKMVKLEHLKIGKRIAKTKGGKQPANIYDITWYDRLNNKGVSKQNPKGFPNGNTLPFKGVSKHGLEQVVSITNNNITSKPDFNKLNEPPFKQTLEDKQRLVKLAEMKKSLIKSGIIK